MRKNLCFKQYVESTDIFGFDKEVEEKEAKEMRDDIIKMSDLPIRQFSLEKMMDSLLEESQTDPRPVQQRFITEMQWGTQAGAMRVVITPKFHAIIERLHFDKQGDPVWLCKRVFGINTPKYAGKEDIVASEIHEVVKLVEREGLENPDTKDEIDELANHLALRFKREPNDFIYFQGIKQVQPENYVIYFSATGSGVGRMVGARITRMVMEYIVDVSYNKEKGLYKIISHFVNETDEGESWKISIPEFEGQYMPSQSRKEIVESIITSLKYF